MRYLLLAILSTGLYSKEFNLRCPIDETIAFEIYVVSAPTEKSTYAATLNVVSDKILYPFAEMPLYNPDGTLRINAYANANEFNFYKIIQSQRVIDLSINRKTLMASGSYRASERRIGFRKKYEFKNSKCSIIEEGLI
tara:strand:- start:124 stop:537 length:414 start_codon:yes stop_codon:yes gene_type:complete